MALLEPQHTDKHVVSIYKKSSGLREAATTLNLSHTRVHQIVRRAAPETLRPRGNQKRKMTRRK
jgi:hypothetical protein